MSKDLEIIKKELNEIPDGNEAVNQCKATYEILKAAERMAEQIESKDEEIKNFKEDDTFRGC